MLGGILKLEFDAGAVGTPDQGLNSGVYQPCLPRVQPRHWKTLPNNHLGAVLRLLEKSVQWVDGLLTFEVKWLQAVVKKFTLQCEISVHENNRAHGSGAETKQAVWYTVYLPAM